MFGTLGGPELFLIFVVALIVFGPRKLPEIGKSLGRMMGEFRKASNEFRSTIESEVEAEKIRDAMRIEVPTTPSPYASAEGATIATAGSGETPSTPAPGTAAQAATTYPGAEASSATEQGTTPATPAALETVSRQDDPTPIEPK